MSQMEHVLIATDGSECGTAATHLGADMAKSFGSRATLVHVIAPPTSYGYGVYPLPEPAEKALLTTAKEILDRAAKVLADAGVDYDEMILRGTPADAILDYAEKEDVDAIVVGHRGLGALGRFFLGSVSNKIVHKAKCAVLVANPDHDVQRPSESITVERSETPDPTLESLHKAFADEGLEAILWSQSPGHVFSEHKHLETQLLRCVAGSLTVRSDDTEVTIHPGDLVRIPAFVPHVATAGVEGVACLEAREGSELKRPSDV